MKLPFSHSEFLDVFGAYNAALWPAGAVLWIVTALLFFKWMWARQADSRAVAVLLAIHWGWSGLAYQWVFFRSINPAAGLFAGLFIVQAVFFAWLALAPERVQFTLARSLRGSLAVALVAYALAYPFVGLAFGLRYPRMPTFGVPCPTTILTAGLLLVTSGAPRVINIIPIAWSVIGGSAAFILGIRADLALIVAGALLALQTAVPRILGSNSAA
ncbi:MAG: hypothetical protein HY349_07730 [Nitrospirae bacterium]|nr:hypothetical protein [Nitrospirota bacterium]